MTNIERYAIEIESHPCSFSFALNCIFVPHDGLENCGCLRSVAGMECTVLRVVYQEGLYILLEADSEKNQLLMGKQLSI